MRRMIGNRKMLGLHLLLALFLLGFTGGCSTLGGGKHDFQLVYGGESVDVADSEHLWPEKGLKKVFSRYWSNRYQGKVRQQYETEAPYIREMIDPVRYDTYVQQARLNQLLKVEILDVVQKGEDFYSIKGRLHMLKPDGSPLQAYIEDEWVKWDGKWHHVLRDTFLFPELS